jgi:integrase
MSNHLVRRGGIWWARLVVPMRLWAAIGRREFSKSCRTHDIAIAKLVASFLLARWRRQLLQVDSRAMPPDILKLVQGSPLLTGSGQVTLAEAVDLTGITLLQLLRFAADGSLRLHCRLSWTPGVIMPIGELGLEVCTTTPSGKRVILESRPIIPSRQDMPDSAYVEMANSVRPIFHSAEIAQEVLANKLEVAALRLFADGNDSVFVSDTPVMVTVHQLEVETSEVEKLRQRMKSNVSQEVLNRAQERHRVSVEGVVTPTGRKAHMRFSQGLAAFAKEAIPQSNKNPKEQERIRKGIALFVELVGDPKLSEISGDVLRAYRDGPLATVPSRLNHAEVKFHTKGVSATIAAIQKSGECWPVMSPAERDQRITWLCRMFQWLTGEWLSEDPSAGLRGVSVLNKAEKKLVKQNTKVRLPFTQDELTLIFEQSWFQTGNGRVAVSEGVNRKWSPIEYWLPLLSLHAGQRIRELCQLHLTDVKQTESGLWYLDINELSPDKSLKNGDSQRIVPLHPLLVQSGFIEWCERLREEGFRRVFPDLIWDPTTGYAKEAKRRMSAMLLGLGMPRDNTKVFHSLRHNANNAFIRLELAMLVPEKIRLRVMGHKAGDDEGSTTYFADFVADENAKYVRLLDFKCKRLAAHILNSG